MSIEAVKNLISNNFGLTQCTTASLSAILPTIPEPETLEALYDNTFSLSEIAAMTTYELLKLKYGVFTLSMNNSTKPSSFFRDIAKRLKHGSNIGRFAGGYMLTKSLPGQDHLIAVTSYHEGRRPKVTVCNTNPKGARRKIITREPLDWLDRNIHPDDGIFRLRAVALIGTRIDPRDETAAERIENSLAYLRAMREVMIQRKLTK